jgi:hypothetical protein
MYRGVTKVLFSPDTSKDYGLHPRVVAFLLQTMVEEAKNAGADIEEIRSLFFQTLTELGITPDKLRELTAGKDITEVRSERDVAKVYLLGIYEYLITHGDDKDYTLPKILKAGEEALEGDKSAIKQAEQEAFEYVIRGIPMADVDKFFESMKAKEKGQSKKTPRRKKQ